MANDIRDAGLCQYSSCLPVLLLWLVSADLADLAERAHVVWIVSATPAANSDRNCPLSAGVIGIRASAARLASRLLGSPSRLRKQGGLLMARIHWRMLLYTRTYVHVSTYTLAHIHNT